MALQPREKKLALAVAALAGCAAFYLLVTRVGTAFSDRRKLFDVVSRDVQQKQFKIAQAGLALEKFTDWEKRSLPSDLDMARTLYQSRLAATMATARLKNVQVEPGRTTTVRDVYAKLPFTVRGQGSLVDVARWLGEYYRADDLHQLRDLALQPSGDGNMQFSATIEALSLPGADRRDRLSDAVDPNFDAARADTLVKTLTERSFFAAYVPPPPPRPPAPPSSAPPPPPVFDESKYAYLTSVLAVGSEPQAWLSIRPTKQTLRLKTGDDLRVGRVTATVVRIGDAEMEIEQDGKRRVIRLGQPLTESGS